ncbi:GNAT family N-acetyltransferase [Micromonospora auratinigra]|uniref:Protein N-acetyltransferase, RimJ/RimL family n=1 Tax=Micromonospora auratinigra TaxID=261654 RepID=A0A1A9A0R7_9ACTN|nr:GNAT family N-acetyltransferase [Micromonospora auratinigra]SBT50020.1 Protein N-acetyltransferase, RimJ/RimL family [Micromonospora auratinigra]
MPDLQRLDARHAPALLRFERENRAYFARHVPDRDDDYFLDFDTRHAALLAEQAAGRCHFHLLVDDDGSVLGRFNLVDVADGSAELGYRVAERATGRGLAQEGVRRVCELARDAYGLRRLVASAALVNRASLAVLRRTGFVPDGEVLCGGAPALRHVRDLTGPQGGTDAAEVHAVLDTLAAAGCPAWISGGWGVDALVGTQTRPHRDLDLAVAAEHESAALDALGRLGYVVETDWRPVRVELVADRGRVDLHPLTFDETGDGHQAGLDGSTFRWPRDCFTTGTIAGRPVGCISVDQQLLFHAGYEPREVDRADLAALHRLATR